MKKVFVLSVFASLSTVVSAQTTRYNVNVYTNPQKHVEYTQPMGNAYNQMMKTYQQADQNAIERERLQLEREQMQQKEMLEMARISAAANADGMKVVSDEVQTLNGTNLATKKVTPIRARVIKRNNGTVEISCLGIKNGEVWKPCDIKLISLQKMYQSAVSDKEKSAILGLMDYGNYILDTENEVFIVK